MRNAALAKAFLAAVVTVLTLAACLLLLRRFAPTLLGLPPDLAVVQSSTEVPPFFDNIFRPSDFDYASPLHVMDESFLIPDPVLLRARPLFDDIGAWGPHDVLGFRNESVPNCADLITIGDSQTYGNNATIRSNWPGSLERSLGDQRLVLYNAAVGGWGGSSTGRSSRSS
jgi:hypothetical protein